jgi:hypothetical protein
LLIFTTAFSFGFHFGKDFVFFYFNLEHKQSAGKMSQASLLALSQFFVLSPRGDPIIFRDCTPAQTKILRKQFISALIAINRIPSPPATG